MSSKLFEPFTLRGTTFKNRVWLAPMCQYSAEDGMPNEWHHVHLGARAAGGFGLILAEATAVTPDGRISPEDTGIWNDRQRDAWKPIVDFIHAQNSVAGIQLAHAGRKASTFSPWRGRGTVPADDGGWNTIAPSAEAFPGYREPREMTMTEIREVPRAFARGARRALEAGFDVVELHAAHGYLLHQFLSPLSNHRTDNYGGTHANRVRLLLEVTDAVREVWPEDKPLFVRVSATDWTDGGVDVAETSQTAALLRERGVDLVDVSSGGNVQADIPVEPGYQVELATIVAKNSNLPVSAVGLITEPAQAEHILAEERADAIMLARAALRDPNWPMRAQHELGLGTEGTSWPSQYERGAWQ
ncbi:NADH:flavin oxidoreductase/NADH oxidase [Arthrobacter tecti]